MKISTRGASFHCNGVEGTIVAGFPVYLSQGGVAIRGTMAGPNMDPKISALERAFQLAQSGQVASIDDIKKRLKRER